MATREEVEAAYGWILGRAPEDEAALAYHTRHPDRAALRRELLASPEFSALYMQMGEGGSALPGHADPLAPMRAVEWQADPGDLARLLARIERSWTEMGGSRAHWSVLTFDAYAPEQLERNRAAFDATAAVDEGLVRAALDRLAAAGHAVDPGATRCLELGSGVGRATRALAGVFGQVTGLDVSAAHLEIAATELARHGAGNVELRHMGTLEAYDDLPGFGFFYSRIVLQHNPPPVQAELLRRILGRLAPGGAALFQVVTRIEDYAYSVAKDLEKGKGGMEMHVLPQPAVFALLGGAGMVPLEIQQDVAAGPDPRIRSHLVLAAKPASA